MQRWRDTLRSRAIWRAFWRGFWDGLTLRFLWRLTLRWIGRSWLALQSWLALLPTRQSPIEPAVENGGERDAQNTRDAPGAIGEPRRDAELDAGPPQIANDEKPT